MMHPSLFCCLPVSISAHKACAMHACARVSCSFLIICPWLIVCSPWLIYHLVGQLQLLHGRSCLAVVCITKTVLKRDLYRHPNLNWVRDPKSASNILSIRVNYFGLFDRYNSNMNILSSENPFIEKILFGVMWLEKMPNSYWTLWMQRYPKIKWVLYFGCCCWR